jgi:hypothetical protein
MRPRRPTRHDGTTHENCAASAARAPCSPSRCSCSPTSATRCRTCASAGRRRAAGVGGTGARRSCGSCAARRTVRRARHGTGPLGGALPVSGGVVISLRQAQTGCSTSTFRTAGPWSPASRTWKSRGRWRRSATTTRRIRRASRCARSAANVARTPAARTV